MKKLNTFTLLLALSAIIFLPTSSLAQNSTQDATKKFGTLLNMLDKLYVDSVDMDELVEVAITKMLEELDPHSIYFSEEDLREANEPLDGSFEGVGVQFNIFKDTIMVVSPIAGGPSERLGIRAGDRIVQVEDEYVAGVGVSNKDVIRLLKGPKGSMVKVFIKRDGEKELLEFNIERDKIPIFSVMAAHMIDEEIGYIKVSRFAKTTLEELRSALEELNSKGMKDLVLDLQGNGGGMLRTAINMSDEFLTEDKLIVYTEGRAFPREDTFTSYEGLFESGRLVILMDGGSASASEIVAGAVQDWDRGLIVGRRSFGKGLVQRPIKLGDGSAIRMTVQKYYTPAGRCIQKSYEGGVEAYRLEKYERFESGELLSVDSLDLPDSLKYYTRIKKRTVYGGGGIIPDVFVPIDTTSNSESFRILLRKGLMSRYALEFVDNNRTSIESDYPTEDDFVANFSVSESEIEKFKVWAVSQGTEESPIVISEEDWTISGNAIILRLKAFIGRNVYNQGTFYRIIGGLNESLQEAVKILKDGTFEKSDLAHRTFK
ncbi:S41 family peptidase [Flavobacteriales bacterium]|nr:S41 family peptidase [Flavobacteriales bacterium]